MDSMHLKLNTDKTDFIIFGWKQQLRKLDESQLDASGSLIPKSKVVRYIGGHLDTSLTFETHIKIKVKTAVANFTKIRSIQDYLSTRACAIPIWMLRITHIDYANAILFGSTAKVINKFQSLQNMCAKLILRRSKHSISMESLYKLHWMPVHQRIDYKILTLTHKCIQEQASKYLQDLIDFKQKQDRNLRSNNAGLLLSQPSIKHKTCASRSFRYSTQYLWNQLPKQLRDTKELPQFKNNLKLIFLT